jgi:O-antigen/teichoic acid export membrane protein
MYAEGEIARFRAVLGKLLAFAELFLVVGVPAARVFGEPLLTFIYRPEYGQRVSLFVIMVATAGVASIASFLGYGVTATRTFRLQVPVIGASTLTTVLLSLLLISRMGSMGAACALLAGACVQVSGCALVLNRAVARLTAQAQAGS